MPMRNDQIVIVRRGDYRAPAFAARSGRTRVRPRPDARRRSHRRWRCVANPGGPRRLRSRATSCGSMARISNWSRWRLDGRTLDAPRVRIARRRAGDSDAPRMHHLVHRQPHPARGQHRVDGAVSCRTAISSRSARPEGFRRITYFPDRPDVMTRFRVTLRAAREPLSGAAGQRQSDRAPASLTTAVTSRSGTIRSPNRATCSRWSPATSWRTRNRFAARAVARRCCRSGSSPAISTRRHMR